MPLFTRLQYLEQLQRNQAVLLGLLDKGWKVRAHFAKVAIKLFKVKWWNRLERGRLLMLTASLSGKVLGDTSYCSEIPFMRFERSLVAKESSLWSSLFELAD